MPPKRRAEDAADARPSTPKRSRTRRGGNDQLGEYKVTRPRKGRRPNDGSFKRGLAKDIEDLVTQARAYQAIIQDQDLAMGEIEFTFKLRKARNVKAKGNVMKEQDSSEKAVKIIGDGKNVASNEDKPPVPKDLEDEIDIFGDVGLPIAESLGTNTSSTTTTPASPEDKKAEVSKLPNAVKAIEGKSTETNK